MRILQLMGHGGVGGTETFAISLGKGLVERGHDAVLVNTWTDSPMNAIAESSGIPFVALRGGGRRIGASWFAKVYGYLRRNRFDLVQTYGLRLSLGLRLMQRTLRVPHHVTGVRGLDQQRTGLQARIDRKTEHFLDLLICNAQAVADRRADVVGTPASRLLVIPNGIDTKVFSPAILPASRESIGLPDGFLFVMVASFRAEKDHTGLLQAMARVSAEVEGARLVLVGGGDGREQVEAEVRRMGLEDRVLFLGPVDNVAAVVRCCDAFVLSSYSEGMPRALMEAMALGMAVVSTRAGGVPEVARDGQDALLVSTRDPASLADAMMRIYRDESLRKRLGAAAVERIRDEFSQDSMFDRYEKVYENLIAGVTVS